jgi:hypothetical protein
MTSSFEPTYKQERGPEIPSFDAYAERIAVEYKALLETDPSEAIVQKFLTDNPSMVPGAFTPGTRSGHWPLHLALISQPPLHGFSARIPDFMWLSTHSGAWYAAMIEIERPGKRLFTAKEVPTAEFNQARHQLVQWRAWFDAPSNVEIFMSHYGISEWYQKNCIMGRHFILVYGRRSEVHGKPALSKQRGALLAAQNEELMSFDRLSPDRGLRLAVSVKPVGDGQFEVIAVPETFGVSYLNARHLASYIGLDDAIERNVRISPERAKFLKRRIRYWIDWSHSGAGGVRGGPGSFVE